MSKFDQKLNENSIKHRPRVLSIAGVDPSGGAGIIADIKSISAFGGYAMAAVAAITAQSTKGVSGVQTIDPALLQNQLNTLSDDVEIDAVKIGLLSQETITVVRAWLEHNRPKYTVLDPVMVATSGDRLLDETAEKSLFELAKVADVVTPNLPELAVWLGVPEAKTEADALAQGQKLREILGNNVTIFLKLGHLEHELTATDYVITPNGDATAITSPRIISTNTHGTGCSLSSALACLMVYFAGDVVQSGALAKHWLSNAINQGKNLQVGNKNTADERVSHGPMDHFTWSIPTKFSELSHILTFDIEERIQNIPFIQGLVAETLTEDQFANYILQDNEYLVHYRYVIEKLLPLAPNPNEREFIALLAGESIDAELEFHNTWLKQHNYPIDSVKMSVVTENYVNLLLKSCETQSYAVILAALYPCMYLYGKIAQNIVTNSENLALDNHKYGAWLKAYSDPAFIPVVDKMAQIIDRVSENISQVEYHTMIKYARQASIAEIEFFEQV